MWIQVWLVALGLHFSFRVAFRLCSSQVRPLHAQRLSYASIIRRSELFTLKDWSADAVFHWICLIPELDQTVADNFLNRNINGRILNILNEELLFYEFSHIPKYQLALLLDEIRLQKEKDNEVERLQLLEAQSTERAAKIKQAIILLGNGLQYRLVFHDNEALRERLREKGIMGLVAEDESRPAFMVDRYEDIRNGAVYRIHKMEEEDRMD